MSLENGTRVRSSPAVPQFSKESAELREVGGENRALDRFCENAQEIANWRMAERVGVREPDFWKPNVYSGFQRISRSRND